MRNKKLPLSIVIPCADDARIGSCLDSIDENVEIVVVLNGSSSEVRKIVNNYKVKRVNIRERNLAKALNIGIEKSIHKKVLLIDSDCKFEKGAIRKLYAGLQNRYIAKGMIVYECDDFISRVIAKVRDYTNYDTPKPYNPFLGIKKSIKKYIGNYYFDSDIHWTEDADLNSRLTKADIKVNYVFSAKAFHPPLSLKQDLRSAFRYGIGKRIRVEKRKSQSVGIHFSKVFAVAFKKGYWAGVYYFVWNCFYLIGYVYQFINDPYKVRPLIIHQK